MLLERERKKINPRKAMQQLKKKKKMMKYQDVLWVMGGEKTLWEM